MRRFLLTFLAVGALVALVDMTLAPLASAQAAGRTQYVVATAVEATSCETISVGMGDLRVAESDSPAPACTVASVGFGDLRASESVSESPASRVGMGDLRASEADSGAG
jgi:hypothetical protein